MAEKLLTARLLLEDQRIKQAQARREAFKTLPVGGTLGARIVTLSDDFTLTAGRFKARPVMRGPARLKVGLSDYARSCASLAHIVAAHRSASGDVIGLHEKIKMLGQAGLSAEWADDHNISRIFSASPAALKRAARSLSGLADGSLSPIAAVPSTQAGTPGNLPAGVNASDPNLQKAIDQVNWLIDQYQNHNHFGGQQPQQMVGYIAQAWQQYMGSTPMIDSIKQISAEFAAGGSGSHKTIGGEIAGLLKTVAPALSAVPVVGAILPTVANSIAGVVGSVGTGNVAAIPGAIIGGAIATVGSAVQGVLNAPSVIANDAQDVAGLIPGISGLIGSGASLSNSFGSSVWTAIEQADPTLSGELTSIFKGLGGTYNGFSTVFDNWSRQLKSANPGSYVMQSPDGGSFFTVVKDALGHYQVSQTPASQVSNTVKTQVPPGAITTSSGMTVASQTPVGSISNSPIGPWAGVSTPPVSAPAGVDQYGQTYLMNSPAKTKAAPAVQEAGASLPTIAVGLGLLGMVLFGGRGKGPLTRSRRRKR